jgi:hypothetical protein
MAQTTSIKPCTDYIESMEDNANITEALHLDIDQIIEGGNMVKTMARNFE